MHGSNIDAEISRDEAVQILSEIRFGGNPERLLSQPTICRWCNELDIPTGQDGFFESDLDRLKAYALHLCQGGNKRDFEG